MSLEIAFQLLTLAGEIAISLSLTTRTNQMGRGRDMAQFAKRVLVFRDGKIRKDHLVENRPRAAEVLKTLPTPED